MAVRGRKPKLTPAVHKSIETSVADGVPLKYAALKAGVTVRVVFQWLAAGRDPAASDEDPCVHFFHAVEVAKAKNVAKLVGRIVKASAKTWQAAAWYLERRTEEFAGDKRELRELRKLVAQFTAERGGADAVRKDATEKTPVPSVERDASGDGPA